IKSKQYSYGCPSISKFNFHTYSGGGRVIAANSLRLGRSEISDELLDIIYQCQMCGACNIPCQLLGEILAPLEIIRELRIKCVEEGQLLPANMFMVDSLQKEDNTLGEKKADRANWAEGLAVKDVSQEKVDVFLHVGCRFSYDSLVRPALGNIVDILNKASVNFGAALGEESCCGGRAFDLGYKNELDKYAEDMIGRVKASGATTFVTPCADCYGTFTQHYPMIGSELGGVEVLHISAFLDRLAQDGVIQAKNSVPMRVTYHDPCKLGRLGENYDPWNGEYSRMRGGMLVPDPPKPRRLGTQGVYDAPRNLLKSVPQLELVEMERNREYSWCCGSGGGVLESYPEFALWTARERINEAKSTGAEAIATSCPWCEHNLKNAVEESNEDIQVFDVMELLAQSM
ncbi:MAG: (Fe-S)-binding protein, partial [Proteobacteria bacterium]|nr:(Fe-S)-binding protein [Pseudomonadota bacterium]